MEASRAFDGWADTYEQSPLQTLLFGQAHASVIRSLQALPAAATLIDVGCGTGRLLRSVAELWPDCRLIGVDPSPRMIAAARALSPGIEFEVGSAEDLPMGNTFADVVTSTVALHHWRDRVRGVKEASRVLRPGGLLVLVDLAGPMWLSRLLKDPPYSRASDRDRLLRDCGFMHIRHDPIRHPYLLRTRAEKP